MDKAKLRQLIEQNTENYKLLVSHEITVYAPKEPSKTEKTPGAAPVRVPNLKKAEYEEFLKQVENGTYVPEKDQDYQERQRPKKRSTTVYSTEDKDPMWKL